MKQRKSGGGSLAVAGERASEGLLFFALFCPLSTINGHKAPFLPSSVVEGGRPAGPAADSNGPLRRSVSSMALIATD